MTRKPRLIQALRVSLLLGSLSLVSTGAVLAQKQNAPKYEVGKILLYMQAGTPRAKVDALAAKVMAKQIRASLMADCYQLILPDTVKSIQETLDQAAQLRTDPTVRWVNAQPVYIPYQAKVEPNDPRYMSGEQWPLRMMNLPQAWALQKGGANVTVGVIDTAFSPDHEDLKGQYHSASRNFADDPVNGTAPLGSNKDNGHGVHVSGIIVAKTDNGIGVAGVCWENVKCVALQTAKSAAVNPFPDGLAIISSYAYASANKDILGIVAVNMSYGRAFADPTDVNDPDYVGTRNMADAGIVPMAAAGNFFPRLNNDQVPAAYPHVVSIAAVGPSGAKSSFSQGPKVELAAPGGEFSAVTDGVLSTFVPGDAYDFLNGTSMASPNAAGVAALLLSTPGVTPARAVQVLKDTANKAGLQQIPDPELGYGIVDAFQALLQVSVQARIQEPNGVDINGIAVDRTGQIPPVETFQPNIRVKIALVKPENVTLSISHLNPQTGQQTVETLTPQFMRQNIVEGDPDAPNPFYTIGFRKRFTPAVAGSGDDNQYSLTVVATEPNLGITKSDTRIFTIKPRIMRGYPLQGKDGTVRRLAFISLPYLESAADSPTGAVRDSKGLLGAGSILYRYLYKQNGTHGVQGDYAVFGSGAGDKNPADAALYPAGAKPSAEGSTRIADISPVGYAWFADLPEDVSLSQFGREFSNEPIRIPLNEGWNMIGNPYPYRTTLNTSLLDTPNGERIPLIQATDNGIILPFFFRYVLGEYVKQELPNGTMEPWEGIWVFLFPARKNTITLGNRYALIVVPSIVPPNSRSTSGATHSRDDAPSIAINGPGSWGMRLEATVGTLRDGNNFIGMTSIGANQRSRTRVPKPPLPAPYVTVGVKSQEVAGTLYSQDLQPVGGTRSWEVVVSSDQQDADVALNTRFLNALPRNYRLTLTDKATGQSVDLRNQRTYRYNTGKTSPTRSFVITARPSTLGRRALLTNVFVNPNNTTDSRSVPTFEIGYNISQEASVEVSVLSATGRQIAVVGNTRAVGTGENRVVWNGRDGSGRAVPAGTYMLQLRALTTDGEVTRVAQPLLITGR
jgi:subtilisin family serine protease